MPKKSSRSRLATSLRSSNGSVFLSNKEPQDEMNDPWCSGDELVPIGTLVTNDENDADELDDEPPCEITVNVEEFDLIPFDPENVTSLITVVQETKELWRKTGFNSGVRGYGTSKRTVQRNNTKTSKRIASGSTSTGLVSWLGTSSTVAVRQETGVDRQEQTETIVVDDEDNDAEENDDFAEFSDIFDEILECQFEQTVSSANPSASSAGATSNSSKTVIPDRYTKREAIAALTTNEASVSRNIAIEAKRGLEHYQVIQAMAIARYFQLLIEGHSLMSASCTVASILYGKKNENSYKARSIRGWASHYLQTGELRIFQQGKFVKTASVITDEHIAIILRNRLREMKDEDRCPILFQELLNNSLLAEIPNAPRSISVKTATRWMYFLGFQPKKQRKGYYTDNHNRNDVVQYRDKVFLPTMLSYEGRMVHFEGLDMTEEILPNLSSGERQVVIITHDETTCYCCEGKALMWMEDGKNKLLPKTKGTSIMISGFACQCHGFFQKPVNGITQKSFQFFEAGVGREGWFTNAHLVKQFEDLTPLIKEMHPDCDIVIGFDNSMTHHAKVKPHFLLAK